MGAVYTVDTFMNDCGKVDVPIDGATAILCDEPDPEIWMKLEAKRQPGT